MSHTLFGVWFCELKLGVIDSNRYIFHTDLKLSLKGKENKRFKKALVTDFRMFLQTETSVTMGLQ